MQIMSSTNHILMERTNTLTTKNDQLSKLINSNGIDQDYCKIHNVTDFINSEIDLDLGQKLNKDLELALIREKFRTRQTDDIIAINQKLLLQIRECRNSKSIDVNNFRQNIKNCLSDMTSILNQSILNYSPLAGSNVCGPAVANLNTLQSIIDPNTPDYSYYLGGSTNDVFTTNDGFEFKLFAISANFTGFEKTIRAARIALLANPNNPNDNNLFIAEKLSSEASEVDLPNALTTSAINSQTIEKIITNTKDREMQIIEDAKSIGVVDVMHAIQELETNRAMIDISRSIVFQRLKDIQKMIQTLT